MNTGQRDVTRVFGKITVTVVHDNIAARKADVLVNGANDQLVMGGGVAGALLARGGIEIQKQAIARAPAPLGSVVRTGAGKLAARYVYHAVVIESDVESGTAVSDVIAAVKAVLERTQLDGVRSLAMPLFGAGVGGLSVRESLEATLEAIEERAGTLERDLAIEVVVKGQEEFEEASAVLQGFKDRTSRSKEENELAAEYLKTLLKGE